MNKFFICHIHKDIKKELEILQHDLGFPSLMSFLAESSYLYFEYPNEFENKDFEKYLAYEKNTTISYNSDKYYQITTQIFINNAKLYYRSASQEFTIFIYRLYTYLKKNGSLPIPKYIEPKFYSILPKLRSEKIILEFYFLFQLINKHGYKFRIHVDEFCHNIFLYPQNNYDYPQRIFQKLNKLIKLSGIKIRINYKELPIIEVNISILEEKLISK